MQTLRSAAATRSLVCLALAVMSSAAMQRAMAQESRQTDSAAEEPKFDRDAAIGRALLLKNKNTSGDHAGRELKQLGASAVDTIAAMRNAGYKNKELADAVDVYFINDYGRLATVLRDAELGVPDMLEI